MKSSHFFSTRLQISSIDENKTMTTLFMINFDLFYSVLSCIIFLFMLAIYLTILYLLAAYSALVKLTEFLLCDATTDSLWNWPMQVISQPDCSATEGGLSKCSCFCLFLLTTLSDLLSEHLRTDLYPSCRDGRTMAVNKPPEVSFFFDPWRDVAVATDFVGKIEHQFTHFWLEFACRPRDLGVRREVQPQTC